MWTSVSDQPTWSPQANPFVALPIKTLEWVTGTLLSLPGRCRRLDLSVRLNTEG